MAKKTIRYLDILSYLFPLVFIFYTLKSIGFSLHIAGIIDNVAFIAVTVFIITMIRKFPSRLMRYILLLGMDMLYTVFFIGNIFYYEVFHDWIHIDIFEQWRVGSSIVGGVFKTFSAFDIFTGILMPFIISLVLAHIPGKGSVRLRGSCLITIFFLGLTIQTLAASKEFVPSENNLINNLLREAGQKVFFGTSLPTVTFNDCWNYYPYPDTSRYFLSTDSSYPLLKKRRPGVTTTKHSILNEPDQKPNIILILMESIRAAESGSYGAPISYTPSFDSLAEDGLLFTNFYANGTQTVRGEFALLCSFYPNYTGSPVYIKKPDIEISTLPGILKTRGYTTMWISAYKSSYSNKNGFLLSHGIDSMYDGHELPADIERIGWGPSDKEIFAYAERILDCQQEPFFAEIMTLSNHWPFSHPYTVEPDTLPETSDVQYRNYVRGTYYTDWAMGNFIKKMHTKTYFDNTIFIITSDHGIWFYPPEKKLKTIEKQEGYFRMPMLFYAPALLEPAISDIVCSQVDVAPTLLDMLGIVISNSFVGQSMIDPNPTMERYALMQHVQRWNLRIKDTYVYSVGNEVFLEHIPAPPRYESFSRSDHHVVIEGPVNLLDWTGTRKLTFGDGVEEYVEWTSELIKKNQYLLFGDRLFNTSY